MLWARGFLPAFGVAGAVGLLASLILTSRGKRKGFSSEVLAGFAAGALLTAFLVTTALAYARFSRIRNTWPAVSAQLEADVKSTVTSKLEAVQRGALEAATHAATTVSHASSSEKFKALESVGRNKRVDALALFSDSGQLVAWSGTHMGQLPPEVRRAGAGVTFSERPLFRYLYVSSPVPNSASHVVAAVLMETSLLQDPAGLGVGVILRDETNADVSMHAPNEASTQRVVYTLLSDGNKIMNVYHSPSRQSDIRARAERMPRQVIIFLTLLAYTIFWYDWIRLHERDSARLRSIPLLALTPVLGLAPFGKAFADSNSIPPMFGLIPWVSGDPLAVAIAAFLPIAAFLMTWKVSPVVPRSDGVRLALAALSAGFVYFLGTRSAVVGVTQAFIGQEEELWMPYQLLLVMCLSSLTVLLFQCGKKHARESATLPLLVAGATCSVILACFVASVFHPGRTQLSSSFSWLWVIPFLLFTRGLPSFTSRSSAFLHVACAALLSTSVLLPQLWAADVTEHIAAADEEISRLGSPSDPHLDYLLDRFSGVAARRSATGDDGVHLLYRTWMESGLAKEPYAAQLSLWKSSDTILAQVGPQPSLNADELRIVRLAIDSATRTGIPAVLVERQPHLDRVLAVPLTDNRAISVVIPPRRAITPKYGGEFFPGHATESRNQLELIPSRTANANDSLITWRMAPGGPISESTIKYADGAYHAHVQVPTASTGILIARGTLLLALDASVLAALWMAGIAGRGRKPFLIGSWRVWSRSIQAQVTCALFAFFLIPTVLFGWFAYRSLEQEVESTTLRVAQEAAARAAVDFNARAVDLQQIAAETRADVLRYLGGELIDASTPGAVQLGAYSGWVPARVYQQLEAGGEPGATDIMEMGGSHLVTAFHSTAPSGILAVPFPLYSFSTIGRTSGFAHLAMFSVLMGAVLSLVLSIVVGRGLTKSIRRLTYAASAVGRGRLNVLLPEQEPGEFGELFRAFNLMVNKLRRARSREVRSARILAWGEMAQQVSHEIKNPLTPMKLSMQHVRRAFNDKHPQFPNVLDDSITQVLLEIDHLDRVARAFSRYGAPEQNAEAGPLQLVAIRSLVEETLPLYRSGHDGTEYRQELPDDLPPVRTRPAEFKEVLLNLLENARDARDIDVPGVITVRAYRNGSGVRLEISDGGAGISPEIIRRVFDPHFSTRSSGTGLGLAIVRRLVEGWGATVSIDSEVGRGTTVAIQLMTT